MGVLVIALGFALPMLTSGGTPDPAPAPRDPATKQAGPAPIRPPQAGGLGASLLKLAAGMIVVCGLCVLVARAIGQKPPDAPGAMDVVASIAVARCVLHLVRAGDRRLLIGTDLGGVKTVLELPGPAPEPPPTGPIVIAAKIAPAAVAAPAAAPPTQDEIMNFLLRVRSQTAASPPG